MKDASDIEDLDFENISYGLTDEDLDEVIDEVRGETFDYSGKKCRVFQRETQVKFSNQKDWFASVAVDWSEGELREHIPSFQSEVWDTEFTGKRRWVISRVGHEREGISREDAEEEAEWLAEQVIMMENDPTFTS